LYKGNKSKLEKMKFVGGLLVLVLAVAVFGEGEESSKKSEVGTVIGIDLGTTYSW